MKRKLRQRKKRPTKKQVQDPEVGQLHAGEIWREPDNHPHPHEDFQTDEIHASGNDTCPLCTKTILVGEDVVAFDDGTGTKKTHETCVRFALRKLERRLQERSAA